MTEGKFLYLPYSLVCKNCLTEFVVNIQTDFGVIFMTKEPQL